MLFIDLLVLVLHMVHIVHKRRADFRQGAFRYTVTVYTNVDKAKILSDGDKSHCDQT